MEKAIEIKRRAQRCILNGDLDGALSEYEKLVASGDPDPYHSVLLADLMYRKEDRSGAARRYLEAIAGYERVGLFKNAIAVCKKMSRLSLSPEIVLRRQAELHALDGLTTESSLYYMQHADLVLQRNAATLAAESLTLAFKVCPDNVRALERLGELQDRCGERETAAASLLEAARRYEELGQIVDAARCRSRAEELRPGVATAPAPEASATARPTGVGHDGGEAPNGTASASGPSVVSQPAAAGTRGDRPVGAREAPPEDDPAETVAARRVDPSEADPPAAAPTAADEPLVIERLPEAFSSPGRPGLAFDSPLDDGPGGTDGAIETPTGLPEVSTLLEEARQRFEQGDRDAAASALVRAAQTYDRLGRYENAAAIYRNLSKGSQAPLQVMMLWLKNCQRRDDRAEAARVACDLGDRALAEGDPAGAREWFERARAYDDTNATAERRLQHIAARAGDPSVATVAEWIVPEPGDEPSTGGEPAPATTAAATEETADGADDRGVISISLEVEEPVGLDLGTLIAEFQRRLEDQIATDPQGHYDLGMSYREMGLLAEAVACFGTAAHDPAFRGRCAEMIGRCRLDEGDFDEAVEQFRTALREPDLDAQSSLDIGFQLGLALEAGGRLVESLEQFERVYESAPNYPDVASKIRGLRRALEKD